MVGGPGDDLLNSRDGTRDADQCGPAWDTVVADDEDVAPGGCETRTFMAVGASAASATLFVSTASINNGAIVGAS
jgi:hypothetical protein